MFQFFPKVFSVVGVHAFRLLLANNIFPGLLDPVKGNRDTTVYIHDHHVAPTLWLKFGKIFIWDSLSGVRKLVRVKQNRYKNGKYKSENK